MIDYIRGRFSGCTVTAAHSAPVCVFLSPHHMLYRHGLWGHGRGAPLRGRHGLILPVLASSQLLLSRLAPMHLWPEGDNHKQPNEHTVGLFVVFAFTLAQPEANFSNDTETLIWRGENVMFLLVDPTFFRLSFIFLYSL